MNTRQNGRRSSQAILAKALDLTAALGRQAATIGALSAGTGMSKAGVFAHIGSKSALDLAVVDAAAERLARDVLAPADLAPPGVARLAAVVEGWLGEAAAGGPAPLVLVERAPTGQADLRERIRAWRDSWQRTLARHVDDAVRLGELTEHTDAVQVAFEIDALLVAAVRCADAGDTRAPAAARRAIESMLSRLATGP